MKLPRSVQFCMDALERAGFACYAVGGCVRDHLLGLTPHDYDLCSAALPQEVCAVFVGLPLVRAGEKHGTIGVVTEEGLVEITTFRTEGDYTDSRHPGWVRFVSDIEGDLARRDFTINAMAYSPTRGFADPFGGREDLKRKILRTVGDPRTRLTEDALRILRGVRFGVKYRLTVETETMQAMNDLAEHLEHIARERIFEELCKLLPLMTAEDLLTFSPVLTRAVPALAPMVGFQQHNPHHAYDVYTHTAHVVSAMPQNLALRWAALLHDTGKIATCTLDEQGTGHFLGHAKASAQVAEQVLATLKAPTALREQVVQLVNLHMTPIEPTKKSVRRWLNRLGVDALGQLLTLQEGDCQSKGVACSPANLPFDQIRALMEQIIQENACFTLRDLAVNGKDLLALGYQGKEIGTALQNLLDAVMEEQLPNERTALLRALETQV